MIGDMLQREDVLHALPAGDLDHVLHGAESAWRSLRGARLFVTGGTGLFGIWLLESIAAANARLGCGITATVLSRDPGRFRARAPHLAAQPFFHWHAGDVRDFAFPAGAHDCVIHAAASSNAAYQAAQPEDNFDTIVNGTQRALEFGARSGAADFLFVSSGAVYGRQPPEIARVPESHLAAELPSAYARGKRAAEQLCERAAQEGGLRPKIARCFAFVGPHLPLDTHFAAGNFLRDALAGRQIVVSGDGTPYRSYLHMADLIVWLMTILVHGTAARSYNVGSDQAISIGELAREISALRDPPLPVRVGRAAAGDPAERYVPDVNRARSELALEIGIGLHDALQRTFSWLRLAA